MAQQRWCFYGVLKRGPAGLLVIGMMLAGASGASAQSIRLTPLGTGAPNSHPDRFGPATLVEAGSQKLLFDVGRGAPIRLNQCGVSLRDVTARCHCDVHHPLPLRARKRKPISAAFAGSRFFRRLYRRIRSAVRSRVRLTVLYLRFARATP